MPKIFQLDAHVADLIAAGEVVERPASVVKELIENSIDAGAGIITVEITAGGMTFIRVTDNGCGIAPEDAKTAFLRHATSKLRGADGLEAIHTLGFRGEALAAIAAVSRIELLTCEAGAGEGVSLSLEAGQVVGAAPVGCPEGTTIIVRDLFFNTPARQKFMKSDRAESSAIASTVLRCALSHPEVSVRFIRDGKTEYHTPENSRIDSCIYSLLGREFSSGLLKAETSDDAVTVTGFVSAASAIRGNRSFQFFFINGRPIRSLTLQAALERAYDNSIPSSRFPSCVLYITTKPANVDVNVHPAKTEVKFISDKQFFDGVYFAALGALELSRSGVNTDLCHKGVAPRSLQSEVGSNVVPGIRGSEPLRTGRVSGSGGGFKSMNSDDFRKAYISDSSAPYKAPERGASGFRPYSQKSRDSASTGDSLFPVSSSAFDSKPFRIVGEALKTYIIAEYQESVWFIDKHAAHERVHFDALCLDGFEPMSQALIMPVICKHGHEDAALLLENADLLDKLGFTVESFGEDAVAIRRIPTEIDIDEAESVLSDICAELKQSGSSGAARRDNIFRAIACKAAIKAGRSSDTRELEMLAWRVFSGEVSHCPHGRPVSFEITKATLERGFRRS